jgi:hypothetical protein
METTSYDSHNDIVTRLEGQEHNLAKCAATQMQDDKMPGIAQDNRSTEVLFKQSNLLGEMAWILDIKILCQTIWNILCMIAYCVRICFQWKDSSKLCPRKTHPKTQISSRWR